MRSFLMGGPKNKNQFRIRPRFRRNRALWAKNTDADGFGICSPLVFDRSAEQIGRKPICPNLIGTGSSLIYQISYLFFNRNQSRIGPRRRQNHKAWPEIWTRTGTDPGLVPVFVKTIRNGLRDEKLLPESSRLVYKRGYRSVPRAP